MKESHNQHQINKSLWSWNENPFLTHKYRLKNKGGRQKMRVRREEMKEKNKKEIQNTESKRE